MGKETIIGLSGWRIFIEGSRELAGRRVAGAAGVFVWGGKEAAAAEGRDDVSKQARV